MVFGVLDPPPPEEFGPLDGWVVLIVVVVLLGLIALGAIWPKGKKDK